MVKSNRAIWLLFFFYSFFATLGPGHTGVIAAEVELTSEAGAMQSVRTLDQTQLSAPPLTAQELPDTYNGFFLASPLTRTDPEKAVVPQAEVTIDVPVPQGAYSEETDLTHIFSKDTYYGTSVMWGFSRVNAENAWGLTRGSGVTIAVIDTGLDMTHADIAGNVYSNLKELNGLPGVDDDRNGYVDDIRGWDFVNWDNNPTDDNGHGTHVSGIAAAIEDNGKGIAGVAPDAKVLAVKVLDASGSGTISNVIKGIRYAADLGAKVINLSLGIAKRYLSASLLNDFQNVVNYALGKGSIVITAAGNENAETSSTAPAGLDNTIAVGATDSLNRAASFSNKNPDLAAPGVSIGSLYPGNGYAYMSGTSMASPFVAGAAALLYSYYKSTYASWTGAKIYNDIYTRLTRSSTDLGKAGYDSGFGYGLLNAYAALTYRPSSGTSTVSSRTNSGSDARLNTSGGWTSRIFYAAASSGTFSVTCPYKAWSWSWCAAGNSEELTDEAIKKKAFHSIF